MSTFPTLLSCAQVDKDVVKSYGAYQISSATLKTSYHKKISRGCPSGSDCEESTCNAGDPGLIPGSGRSPGEANATYSSILAWRKPRTEEPGGLQSTGLQGVKHYWATNTFFSLWKEETKCETMGRASWRVYPWLLRCTHTERIWSQVSGLLSGIESPRCSGRVFKSTFTLSSNSNWFHSHPLPHTGCRLLQSCLTLCNPMDCSPPDSSVYGILQARILEWAVISFSRDLPDPGIEPVSLMSPALVSGFFTTSTTWDWHFEVKVINSMNANTLWMLIPSNIWPIFLGRGEKEADMRGIDIKNYFKNLFWACYLLSHS